MAAVKKRKVLTLENKVKVIKLSEKGESSRKLALEFDVGKTQINNIIKDKGNILATWESGSLDADRRLLKAKRQLYPDLNERVYEWFCQARAKNIPISGRLIQEKAILLSAELNYDNFTASNGWLSRFTQRHNIKCSVLSGEANEVDNEVVEDWTKRLHDMCEGYDLRNIFNCDETGLFYRLLPNRGLVQKNGDNCHGGKKSKERITVLLTASAMGEKLKPVVIGKSQNPRSFKGYHKNNLRVYYESNRKAWMTTTLFTSYLQRLNNMMRIQDRKILLFVDNCSSHPSIELSHVKLKFFPPNTTAKLQPMDAGIIQNVKMIYRKKLLRHVLFLMDEISTASEISRQVTVLDAIQWLTSAWDTVSEDTIQKCFRKCGFDPENLAAPMDDMEEEWDEEDLLPLLPSGMRMRDFVHMDDALQTEKDMDSELYETNTCDELLTFSSKRDQVDEVESDSDCEDSSNSTNSLVSLNAAWDYTSGLFDYALQQNNTELLEVMNKAKDLLQRDKMKAMTNRKQSTISSFFKAV